MSDFRIAKLPQTEYCNYDDYTVLFNPYSKETCICQLSNILSGGILGVGLMKTGYVTMADNPKCYPLSVDEEGRGFAKIEWFDTVISSMEYDESKKSIVLKMNDESIKDIEVPVEGLINKYYPDDVTISADGNVFGVRDGILEPYGDYISAYSEDAQLNQTRMIDGIPQQRCILQTQYCVRTDFDFSRTRGCTEAPILDFRDNENPKINYWSDEQGGYISETLSSYDQLHGQIPGLDIRAGEFIYNTETSKLWYLKSTDVSTFIQLDEDFSKITYYDNL